MVIAPCFLVSVVFMSLERSNVAFGRGLREEVESAVVNLSDSPQDSKVVERRRLVDILDHSGFQFARSPSEFMLEAGFAAKSNADDAPLYSNSELKVIQRALNTMRGFMHQGLWSGSHASMHFMGTGSCLIKLKRPALEVAAGVLHGIYLQKWRKHAMVKEESACDQRFRLRQVLGSELEELMWIDTGVFGNGPWSTCVTSYIKLWKQRSLPKKDEKLDKFLKSAPLHLLLCDEVEEAMGGDAVLSSHWKRRDTKFFDELAELSDLVVGDDRLINWIESARAMSHTVHPAKPMEHYKELTPTNFEVLFNTTEFHPEAHPEDVQRWKFLVETIRADQSLIPPYLKPGGVANKKLIPVIKVSRHACDSLAIDKLSVAEYLEFVDKMLNSLSYCEQNDERFKTMIPMPDVPPSWAIPE